MRTLVGDYNPVARFAAKNMLTAWLLLYGAWFMLPGWNPFQSSKAYADLSSVVDAPIWGLIALKLGCISLLIEQQKYDKNKTILVARGILWAFTLNYLSVLITGLASARPGSTGVATYSVIWVCCAWCFYQSLLSRHQLSWDKLKESQQTQQPTRSEISPESAVP